MTIKTSAIAACLFDVALWIATQVAVLIFGSDMRVQSFNAAAGWVLTPLFLASTAPALVFTLTWRLGRVDIQVSHCMAAAR